MVCDDVYHSEWESCGARLGKEYILCGCVEIDIYRFVLMFVDLGRERLSQGCA